MKLQQLQYFNKSWKVYMHSDGFDRMQSQLVFAFGAPSLITEPSVFNHLERSYPEAHIILCSTSGEIMHNDVFDNSVVVTAVEFRNTTIVCAETNITDHKSSFEAGHHLMQQLQRPDLNAVFIISDGTFIHGRELVDGFNATNARKIPVTGALAADAARFTRAYVGLNGLPGEGVIVAVGFCGQNLKVSHGSFGGWDAFGPTGTITHSDRNILYEIDQKNALEQYKEFLGPFKQDLPGSALLFPFSVKPPGFETTRVRTILNINERDRSMVFAGDMPVGSQVQLMKANFNKLVDGSAMAARHTCEHLENKPELAILISCIGRKLMSRERTEEEVQAVNEIFGTASCTTGFYSYGGLSSLHINNRCEMQNQTMTITTFTEL